MSRRREASYVDVPPLCSFASRRFVLGLDVEGLWYTSCLVSLYPDRSDPPRSLLDSLDTLCSENKHYALRPLVVSPPNRRRAAAGRRRPKVRGGSRNGSRGSVVLRLDHDNDDESDLRVWSSSSCGAAAMPGTGKLDAVSANQRTRPTRGGDAGGGGVGGGVHGEHEGNPEERSKKRPLAGEGPRKRGKMTPPPPPPPLPSSWLALRKALHERYRDSEEHKAAEQTEAEAAERGRRGWGGSGSNGRRGGWGGEVMLPGLR